MKKFFACLFASVAFQIALSQDTNTVVINPAKQNEHDLVKRMYQYPEFVMGKAFYKNESATESKLNYSYLTNNIFFISPKGDTLALLKGEEFSKIVVGSDTFCYYNKEFIQQLTHYSTYNLFVKRSLRYNGTERKGAYGSYSGTAASSSLKNMNVNEGRGDVKLTPDENIIYIFSESYFLSGKFARFYPASKKGVHELFAKNEKQLKDFLEKNKINFSKKEDLEKLLDFARSILN